MIDSGAFGTVVTPTGKTWMDRNLGATKSCSSQLDTECYGSLFQWGRRADGHEIPTSELTGTKSVSPVPGHNEFIKGAAAKNWLTVDDKTLWAGVNAPNKICPDDFRAPTKAELLAELDTFKQKNGAGAFDLALRIPLPGYRLRTTGIVGKVDKEAHVWSGDTYIQLSIIDRTAKALYGPPAQGYSVRCIKD